MKTAKLSKRSYVLLGVLALLAAVWVASLIESRVLGRTFSATAQAHTEEFRGDDMDTASTITVGREFGVLGTPVAKVEVFMKKRGVEENVILAGISYQYKRIDGAWELMESGACTSEECHTRGEAAFAALN